MSPAFYKSVVVKEYKAKIESLLANNQQLEQRVGKLTIEKDCLGAKLVSLVSSDQPKVIVDSTIISCT